MNSPEYNSILNFDLDQSVAFSFSQRLAAENGWTKKFTDLAILEYKKFIYLCSISEQSLTPSDQVDQVWHLHMIYTNSYWYDFCDNTIGKRIEHNPTEGGKAQRDHFTHQYNETLKFYKETFKKSPPKTVWPPARKRFGVDASAVRVHKQKYKVVRPYFQYLLVLVGCSALPLSLFLDIPFLITVGVTSLVYWLFFRLMMPAKFNAKSAHTNGKKSAGSGIAAGCGGDAGCCADTGCGAGCGGGGCGGGGCGGGCGGG